MSDKTDYDSMSEREFLEHCRDTHTQWAEWFEANPEEEAKYLATGDWEGAKEHRGLANRYQTLINKLSFLEKAFWHE